MNAVMINDLEHITLRHLTPREIDRLLARYDLAPRLRRAIWRDLDMESDYYDEISWEHASHGSTYRRQRSAFDLYCAANPVYGCEHIPMCRCGMRQDVCECELPF